MQMFVHTNILLIGDYMIFSAYAFIIGLRETIEAALIIGILLAYLSKIGMSNLRKQVYYGSTAAIISSVIFAVLIEVIIGDLEERNEQIFEAVIMIVASALLTWVIIQMMQNAKYIKHNLHNKVNTMIDKSMGIFIVAYIAILREGIETVIFVIGADAGGVLTTIISTLSGILTAIILAVLLYHSSINMNISMFFKVTSIILIIFAAGIFTFGVHELQELGLFGAETAIWNVPVADFSSVLNDKTGFLGPLLRSLVGYQDKPTGVEIIAYISYWIFISILYFKNSVNFKSKSESHISTS